MAEPSNPNDNRDENLARMLEQGLSILRARQGDLAQELIPMERPSLRIPSGLLDEDIAALINAESEKPDFGFRTFLLALQCVRVLRASDARIAVKVEAGG